MVATAENTPPRANQEAERSRRREDIHQQIREFRAQKAQMTAAQKEAAQRQIGEDVKNELRNESARADKISRIQDDPDNPEHGQVPNPAVTEAQGLQNGISLFVEAAAEGLIQPPTHAPSRQVFTALIDKLQREAATVNSSAFLQPLLVNLVEVPNYITFSLEGQPPTQFEQDLKKIVSTVGRSKAEEHLEAIVAQAGGSLGITLDRFNAKKDVARVERVQYIQQAAQEELRRLNEEMARRYENQGTQRDRDRHVKEQIMEGVSQEALDHVRVGESSDVKEVREALKLFDSMDSPSEFYNYYKRLHEDMYQQILAEGRGGSTEENKRKRAGKEATRRIHELLMFMTHKIFSPVIEASGEAPWERLAAQKSRNYFMSLEMAFNNLMGKFDVMKNSVSDREPIGEDEVYFFKYGNMTEKKWETIEGNQVNDPKTGKTTVVGGKFVDYSTPSAELLETESFKELLDDLYLSGVAEHDFLVTGTNFNFIMNKGVQGQDTTFFRQAAAYAKETLQAHRLDELYKLPYAELIEAAKIQISSYYKKKFAQARWIKDPEILQGLFSNLNEAEKEALKDMLSSYKDVPEWAIRRAMIHARMHLSLVNLEMHALSSYAQAPVDWLGKATYRDPALKDLDVFDTWYLAKQWQMSDMYVKGLAFLPQPDRRWKKENWIHEDIRAEGEDIYSEAFQLGSLAKYGRKEYTKDMTPNIFELNPMGAGGIETRLGWRMKYSIFPWFRDMLDNLNNANKLNPNAKKNGREFEYVWKRIENIGINPMKILRDELLFDDSFLKLKDGVAVNEEQYKNLFRYLYERYFKEGVGREGMSLSFMGKNREEREVSYKDISSSEEFWDQVVEPILNRKRLRGQGGPSASILEKQNTKERTEDLKKIVDQALGVLAFERVPMDFAFVENPTRSQNGVTLLNELELYFQTWDKVAGRDDDSKNKVRDDAFDDILFVQQRARIESAKRMNDFVIEQADTGTDIQKTVYGSNLASLDSDRSNIKIYDGQTKMGYLVDEGTIRHFLQEKYGLNGTISSQEREEAQLKIDAAIEVYRQLMAKVVVKPMKNDHEKNPMITETRQKMAAKQKGVSLGIMSDAEKKRFDNELKQELKATFEQAREHDMTTRMMWSTVELLGNEIAMPINDTAYQFMEFKRAGRDMVQRTVTAIADTQEAYKKVVGGGDLNSALKKYYRKEDTETLHKLLVEMRTSIKEEDVDWSNDMEMRVLENAINVMRINSDAEDLLVEGQYIVNHRDRAAFSMVVKEGPQYPLRREDRYRILQDYLHYAQLPKRVKADEEIYELMTNQEHWGDEHGWIGGMLGNVADILFGSEDGKLVRQRWKEKSGEGIRDREIANLANLLIHEGPKYIILAALAILLLGMIKGYQESEKA
ncbi:MAG: hypothetical protein US54_C0021G0017 [Candidatus Roizmanbacteria bacterium GW2011_GWA2_37_7]|uniref:Uncharacterized protein n=1 Tax=Candidatus Roizmanbacteria bacterium GW2011_GWA2_37_7 TaxID=1618481 RepID=A0A0G0HHF9_9BACT|nr:MAG: hypothetical protein US54_C0021G0017 [Candidatus Roizmanbacteria bacterium GW2011_GWA2_37_7]